MLKFIRNQHISLSPKSVPLAVIALALLAYGLYLGWLGFYWDDWVWMYFLQRFGPAALLQIDRAYRPLAGYVLALGGWLFGEHPLGWQIYNLCLRLLTTLSFWWLLRRLWPYHGQQTAWASLLFLVYPGFTHQFVAVNTSRHLASYIPFLLSLGLMVIAVRRPAVSIIHTSAALIFSLVAMLTSEYFYGLELVRPFVLWLLLPRTAVSEMMKKVWRRWLPYFSLLLLVFGWRLWVSRSFNYEVTFLTSISTDPITAVWKLMQNLASGIYHTLISAWATVLQFPQRMEWGDRVVLYFWLMAVFTSLAYFFYLYLLKKDAAKSGFCRQSILLGGAALLLAGLPFLVTQLSIEASFPNNRSLLPMSFGAVLLLIGLIDLIPLQRLKLIVLALMLGLVTARHYYTALEFRLDWAAQQRFFQQLNWRVPDLAADTALLTVEVPIKFSSDNSLSGPLNHLYATNPPAEGQLDYLLYYLDLRLGRSKGLQKLGPDVPINKIIHLVTFSGSTSQAVVLYYAPPRCLRILHPLYDQYYPALPELLQQALPLSDLSRIDPDAPANDRLFALFDSQHLQPDWCYYFERADLARQHADWSAIVELGDTALKRYQPYHATELIPFIQAYALTGNLQTALELNDVALNTPDMAPILCRIWGDIAVHSALPPQEINQLEEQLGCSLP